MKVGYTENQQKSSTTDEPLPYVYCVRTYLKQLRGPLF